MLWILWEYITTTMLCSKSQKNDTEKNIKMLIYTKIGKSKYIIFTLSFYYMHYFDYCKNNCNWQIGKEIYTRETHLLWKLTQRKVLKLPH